MTTTFVGRTTYMQLKRALIAGLVFATVLSVTAQGPPAPDPFYRAIREDDLTALRALVAERGPNVKDAVGQTPLIVASAFGSRTAVALLVDAGADVRAANNAGVTALHVASADPAVVRQLLERGADVHARTVLGRTPLLVASSAQGTGDVVSMLLDKGADVNVADNLGVTPLIAAATIGDTRVARLLLSHDADANARAEGMGSTATPLMGAARNGDVELTRLLLAKKPDVNVVSRDETGLVKNGPVAFGSVTALHMAALSGSSDVVKMLIDAGAHIDAGDIRGMTALMWAVATDRPEPRVIRTLLEKGADSSIISKAGENVRDWVRKFNNPSVLREFQLSPTNPEVARTALDSGAPASARKAVERSMPLLRTGSRGTMTEGGCIACHAQPLTTIAAELANRHGWRVETSGADALLQAMQSQRGGVQTFLQGREAGALPDGVLYDLWMMASLHAPSTPATDGLVSYLVAKQHAEGNWKGQGATRAPMQDGDFSRTALAIRALVEYGTPARKAEFAARVARAAAWLESQTPLSTEDRVMQLLGLKWARVPSSAIESRRRELLAAQLSTGGWAQTPYLAGDAYATGQVLYALSELGARASDSPIQRGAAFLVRTQGDDGTWDVKSRAMKIQPYFESGFPHGHDQWISQAGTAWAAMGLVVTAGAE